MSEPKVLVLPQDIKDGIFHKYEIDTIRRNLAAFINNFGMPKFVREDVGKGFYVYYPDDASSHIQFCPDINYLDGWLYGVVQGHQRGEFTKMRSIGILHFDELEAKAEPREEDIIITSSMTRKELNDLAYEIADAKEMADKVFLLGDDVPDVKKEVLKGFVPPDDWGAYDWSDKIDAICEHFSLVLGTFQIEKAETAVASSY